MTLVRCPTCGGRGMLEVPDQISQMPQRNALAQQTAQAQAVAALPSTPPAAGGPMTPRDQYQSMQLQPGQYLSHPDVWGDSWQVKLAKAREMGYQIPNPDQLPVGFELPRFPLRPNRAPAGIAASGPPMQTQSPQAPMGMSQQEQQIIVQALGAKGVQGPRLSEAVQIVGELLPSSGYRPGTNQLQALPQAVDYILGQSFGQPGISQDPRGTVPQL